MNAMDNLKSKLTNFDEDIVDYEDEETASFNRFINEETRNTIKEVAINVEDTSTFLLKDLLSSTASSSIKSCKKRTKKV